MEKSSKYVKASRHQGHGIRLSIHVHHPYHTHQPNACSCDNAWLTLLISLHHSTCASMHVYIHMHVHGIQTNQDPNRQKRDKTNKTKPHRETQTQR